MNERKTLNKSHFFNILLVQSTWALTCLPISQYTVQFFERIKNFALVLVPIFFS